MSCRCEQDFRRAVTKQAAAWLESARAMHETDGNPTGFVRAPEWPPIPTALITCERLCPEAVELLCCHVHPKELATSPLTCRQLQCISAHQRSLTGDVVERVAQVIWGSFRVWGPPIREDKPTWERLGESNKHLAREMARAAIEALREPSHAMFLAMERSGVSFQTQQLAWPAAIDAALKESNDGK
jgi:hypothetical protein